MLDAANAFEHAKSVVLSSQVNTFVSFENALHAEIVRVSVESAAGTLLKKTKKHHKWEERISKHCFLVLIIFRLKIINLIIV